MPRAKRIVPPWETEIRPDTGVVGMSKSIYFRLKRLGRLGTGVAAPKKPQEHVEPPEAVEYKNEIEPWRDPLIVDMMTIWRSGISTPSAVTIGPNLFKGILQALQQAGY